MRSDSVLHLVADWLLVAALPAPLAFLVLYARVRWWETLAGRALMLKAAANVAVLGLAASAVVLGPNYPGREVIRVVAYLLVLAALYYLLGALVRYQYPDKWRRWTHDRGDDDAAAAPRPGDGADGGGERGVIHPGGWRGPAAGRDDRR